MSEITQNRGQGLLMVARITVEAAAAFFITAGLLNYGVTSSAVGRHLAQWQLVPAVTALALPPLALWLVITLTFGRIYCSTVCPLGALMDLAARTRPRSRVYRYKRGLHRLRTVSFSVVGLLLLLRVSLASEWLEPFGLYASVVRALTSGRVCLAAAVGAVVVGAVTLTAYRRGRLICNTLCPVGAALGFISRRSAFRIDIDTDRCVQCRRCVDVCKAECIDPESHVADMSRCVVCFDCLPGCPNDAISYTLNRHTLSDPLLQKIKSIQPSPKISNASCDSTSTSCKTSSTTEPSKPTEPEPER